jgi:dTDP-4-dehydrorhamnose reductase
MKIKVLILGKTGMLGHVVYNILAGRPELDISGTHLLDQADFLYFNVEHGMQKLRFIHEQAGGFHYIINCIGITADKIDSRDSKSRLRAIKINAAFPHELALFAGDNKIRVIHMSTDGVFSGQVKIYDEDTPSDCTDFYGRTKSLGEPFNDQVINIRCSIIGPSPYEKGGLYEWFLKQPDGATISGFTNHIWSGISTLQFAELCQVIINGNHFDALRAISSVFHFAPNLAVSKYELLKLFQSSLGKRINIIPAKHPGGMVKRLLQSRFDEFINLYPHCTPMEDIVNKMNTFK